jgi:hypothetical protein
MKANTASRTAQYMALYRALEILKGYEFYRVALAEKIPG